MDSFIIKVQGISQFPGEKLEINLKLLLQGSGEPVSTVLKPPYGCIMKLRYC